MRILIQILEGTEIFIVQTDKTNSFISIRKQIHNYGKGKPQRNQIEK